MGDLSDQFSRLEITVSEQAFEGFSLVEDQAPEPVRPRSSDQSSRPQSAPLSVSEREEICRGIGRFIRRALSGDHRGSSGRDQIQLASRLWLVFRNHQGEEFLRPCKLLHRFSEVKRECSDGRGDWGDSVFVGLPGLIDARRVVETAGASLPQ